MRVSGVWASLRSAVRRTHHPGEPIGSACRLPRRSNARRCRNATDRSNPTATSVCVSRGRAIRPAYPPLARQHSTLARMPHEHLERRHARRLDLVGSSEGRSTAAHGASRAAWAKYRNAGSRSRFFASAAVEAERTRGGRSRQFAEARPCETSDSSGLESDCLPWRTSDYSQQAVRVPSDSPRHVDPCTHRTRQVLSATTWITRRFSRATHSATLATPRLVLEHQPNRPHGAVDGAVPTDLAKESESPELQSNASTIAGPSILERLPPIVDAVTEHAVRLNQGESQREDQARAHVPCPGAQLPTGKREVAAHSKGEQRNIQLHRSIRVEISHRERDGIASDRTSRPQPERNGPRLG